MEKIKITAAVFVSLLSFISFSAFAQVSDDTTTVKDFNLEDLMDISVETASKSKENVKDAPAVMSVVTSREIEAYGAITLFEVLDRVTGVYMFSNWNTPKNQVILRGQSTEGGTRTILFLIDGRPVRESSTVGTIHSVISAFPLSRIERIEIVRGPGSVLYGSKAFTGVINIITKKGAAQELNAKVGYGTFNTAQGTISGGKKIGNVEVAAGVNFLDSKGWDFTARGPNDYIRNKANTADSLYLDPKTIKEFEKSIGVDASIKYKGLRFATNISDTKQAIMSYSGLWRNSFNPFATGPLEYEQHVKRIVSDLNYQKEFSSTFTSSVSVTHNHFTSQSGRPVLLNDKYNYKSDDVIAELTNFIKPTKDLNIVLGGYTETQTGEGKSYNWSQLPNGAYVPYNILDTSLPLNPNPIALVPKYNKTNWSVYLQTDYKIASFLKIIAGAQANKIANLKLNVVPRVGTIITLTKSAGIKLLYGQAFRSPTAQELGFKNHPVIYGNPNLTPEKIGTFEAQIFYAKPNGEVSLTYYNSNHYNIIRSTLPTDSVIVVNGISIVTLINEGTLKSQGIELEGKAYLSKTLTLLGSATYQTQQDQYGNEDVLGMPKLMMKAGVNYNSPFGLSLALFNSYFGKGGDVSLPYTRNMNPEAKPYNFMTANVSYNINKLLQQSKISSLTIGVFVQNLLNEKIYYPEPIRRLVNSLPGRPGRSINFQITAKF